VADLLLVLAVRGLGPAQMTEQAEPAGVTCTTRKSGPVAKSVSRRQPRPA
jgi:hypothetical protein